jgi:hypothetical protein
MRMAYPWKGLRRGRVDEDAVDGPTRPSQPVLGEPLTTDGQSFLRVFAQVSLTLISPPVSANHQCFSLS